VVRIEGRLANRYDTYMATRLFQIDDLRTLVERNQWPCVSLYLPTHRAGRQETREDPIRLKNAVGRAAEQLAAAGYRKDDITKLLEPAASLVTSRDFWLERADGLAVFVTPGLFQYYRVPLTLQDEVAVADHFSVKQLIPLFSGDGHFYILAFSQKRIRFYEATRTSIQELAVPEMLKSIDDLRQFDEAQAQLQGHTMALAGTAATANVVFHGQGSIADKATYKAEVMQYVSAVSKKLERYLGAQTVPLVLAAVEYEQAFYREANSYRSLLDEGVLGNPDGLDDQQIHRAAWEVVEPHFSEARRAMLGHFGDLSNTDKTSDRIEKILPAACHGQVRTLFIETQARTWGRFNAEGLSVEIHKSPAQGDVDLIDLATVYVLQSKGMIYALPRDQMPTPNPQAAIFRY
jgi:hypothetical protein